MSALPLADTIIFIILCQPTLYIWWKHGRRGFLGWFYLQLFCGLRIIGSISQLIQEKHHNSSNYWVQIINSIGLSPLLLAALGLLHEARRARNQIPRNRLEWFLVIQYHLAISVAFVLIIIGITKADKGQQQISHSIFIKIGIIAVSVCWGLLLSWALISLRYQPDIDELACYYGSKLLHGVLAAIPFIAIRIGYAALMFFTTNSRLRNSTSAKIALSVVPEVIVTVVFVIVGLNTRNMWKPRTQPKRPIPNV